jgi:hypothetical protein
MFDVLVVAGFLLSFAASGIYIVSIFRGRTKPHLFTHLVWAIVTLIAFFGSLVSGGGYGAWIIGITGFFSIVITLLSLKYGTKDIQRVDMFFLVAAILSIIPWLILRDPLWTVVLATGIDFCGYMPTIRKTWKAPESEALSSWILGSVKSAVGILALGSFSITTVIFPLEIVIMNAIVVGIIVVRRRNLGRI